jgi:molybdopterin-guanine dinucleotide biosynthesis protein A
MGTQKAFLEVRGQRIIEAMLHEVEGLFEELLLATNNPQEFGYLGLSMIQDEFPGAGPLGGIYSGLKAAANDRCFVFACDMPFLSRNMVRFMMERCHDVDVLIPETSKGCEPLHAIYSKRCLGPMKARLSRGDFRIRGFFPEVTVGSVGERELRRLDPDLRCFMNLNTREDLLRAQWIAAQTGEASLKNRNNGGTMLRQR